MLFLSFRDIVSEIDKEGGADSEMRQRRGGSSNAAASTSASSTAVEQRPSTRTISPEVRELLRCWKPAEPECLMS